MRRRSVWWLVSGVLAGVVVLTACGFVVVWRTFGQPAGNHRCPPLVECFPLSFWIQNYRTDALLIRITTTRLVSTRTVPGREETNEAVDVTCHASLLVAVTATGAEVARLPGPICAPAAWIFEPDGSARLVNGGAQFRPLVHPT